MTTIRQLKIAHGAGDPYPVLALRIDVVAAAEKLVTAIDSPAEPFAYELGISTAQSDLYASVRRVVRARAARGRE